MTSKEILKKLEELENNKKILLLLDICIDVKKDLEVLKILKKYLYIGGDSITEKIKLKWDSIDEITDKNEFAIIKEWLENDR